MITRRPVWTTADWWRQPAAPIYFASLVLSLGRGAWFTCWAVFFTRSVGLSAAQFGIGITVAGLLGLIAGGPVGYLADRVGRRETLVALGTIQGLALLSYAFVTDFWPVMVVTAVMIAAERSTPGVRVATIAGLIEGKERMAGLATMRVTSQIGIVAGAGFGAVVLSMDNRAGYLALVLGYGGLQLICAALVTRVPHLPGLRDRKVKRRMLVLRDRPFLVITFMGGLLALNWGMLDSGVPLWITNHAHAPLWLMGVLMGGNAAAMVIFQHRASKASETVPGAARTGLWSGILLAVSCVVFAVSYHQSATVVAVVLLIAASVHVVGELFFVASGWGLSVGLTPEDAHGEYQGMFGTGYAAAMVLAPGLMTLLLVEWRVAGWFALAALYLVGGVGTVLATRWALRERPRAAAETPLAAAA